MSKTNHRRQNVKTRYFLGQRPDGEFTTLALRYRGAISGEMIAAVATVASENSRGVRRDRAGAKSFVHTRFRRREDNALHHNLRNGEYDEQ